MKIFCSGIGGIGLSAYAALQNAEGHTVFGSDRSDSALLEDLRTQGITISLTQDGSFIPDDCDLFVYSEAVPETSPERVKALQLGIRSISYFAALGEISKGRKVIAVAGTHGKSSTTAMLAKVLIDAGMDPTIVVGTKLPDLQGQNWRKGKSDWFLLEACEYRRSFLFLSPSLAIVTTVDGDHFDYFGSLQEYEQAFVEFLEKLPVDGPVIIHGEDAAVSRIAKAANRTVIDADVLPLPELSVPGLHMRQNAQLALAAAEHLEIDRPKVLRALQKYKGAWRRMERVGVTVHDVPVIDDYGHHPKEIQATLQGVREQFPTHRIVCVFQPHTHDRTIKLYDDFTRAFRDADLVIVPNIYEARREKDSATVDVDRLIRDIADRSGVRALHGQSLKETERLLREETLQSGDVLLCMGAGDITALAQMMTTPSG